MDDGLAIFLLKLSIMAILLVPMWLFFRSDSDYSERRFFFWVTLVGWSVFGGLGYLLGGMNGVLLAFGGMVGLALVWAAVWTVGQSLRNLYRQSKAMRRGTLVPASLLPFHQRFMANFRTTLFELPLRMIDGM